MTVVRSASHRAAFSLLMIKIARAPASGRNVVTLRIGYIVPSDHREHRQCERGDDAGCHGEAVVLRVARHRRAQAAADELRDAPEADRRAVDDAGVERL